MKIEIISSFFQTILYVLSLSIAGACFSVLINEFAGRIKGIKFHLKMGIQFTKELIWLGVIFLLSSILINLFWYKREITDFYVLYIICSLIIIFSLLYINSSKAQLFFLLVSTLLSLFLVYTKTAILHNSKNLIVYSIKFPLVQTKYEIFSIIFNILISIGIFSFLGNIYVLIRRNKDNFGRDYYRYALRYTNKWCFFILFSVYLWIQKYIMYKDFITQQKIYYIILAGVLILISLSLCFRITKSDIPLRFKGSIILSGILMLFYLWITFYILMT